MRYVVAKIFTQENGETVSFWTGYLTEDGDYCHRRSAAHEFTSQVAAQTAADAAAPRGSVLSVVRRKRWLSYARKVMTKLIAKKAAEQSGEPVGNN